MLTYAGRLDRGAVAAAARALQPLVRRPEVAAAWTRESSCAAMSVGGLTWHLVTQPRLVVERIRAGPEPDAETIEVLEHYARAAWVREGPDGEANRSIRTSSDAQAREGVDAASAVLREACEEIEATIASAPTTVFVPWQGWALATDDFLVTRMMEMVVHADDLAASIDVPTPDFGPAVLDPVLGLLTALAVRRHGHDALVRTLARPQRAPGDVAAF